MHLFKIEANQQGLNSFRSLDFPSFSFSAIFLSRSYKPTKHCCQATQRCFRAKGAGGAPKAAGPDRKTSKIMGWETAWHGMKKLKRKTRNYKSQQHQLSPKIKRSISYIMLLNAAEFFFCFPSVQQRLKERFVSLCAWWVFVALLRVASKAWHIPSFILVSSDMNRAVHDK